MATNYGLMRVGTGQRHSVNPIHYFLLLPLAAYSLNTAGQDQTMPPWKFKDPYFTEQARAILEARCTEVAGEFLYGTAEDVSSVFVRSIGPGSGYRSLTASSDGRAYRNYGVSYTHLHYQYFRIGLSTVEFDATEVSPSDVSGSKTGNVARLDTKTRRMSLHDDRQSSISITYKKISSEEDERHWIFGREISINDDSKGTVLARRKEFFWINQISDLPRVGSYFCPSLELAESTPHSFFSKAINTKSYVCYRAYQSAVRAQAKRFDGSGISGLQAELARCEAEYFASRAMQAQGSDTAGNKSTVQTQ